MSCFIIAEAGVNHNGDLGLAKELVHAAHEAGADAVKFQTFKAETLVTPSAATAAYQQANTQQSTQFSMLKALELAPEDYFALSELAHSLGIEFMSTAFDEASVDFLVELGVQRLKVPSGEITNYPLLSHIAQQNLPIILSTGMCELAEVAEAVAVLQQAYPEQLAQKLVILHCTSNYPADFADINLKAMQTMAQYFHLPVGYSDHSLGYLVPTLAVALGACVIEKHFTLDNQLPGPDHKASLNIPELKNMVIQIRNTELCLGNGEKSITEAEKPIRDLVRRSLSLKNSLPKGSLLNQDDLILLRPGTGILPKDISKVVGSRLKQDLAAGSSLSWEHVEC